MNHIDWVERDNCVSLLVIKKVILTLAQKLGFEVDIHFEDGTADMVLVLNKV